ncbi:DegQ family serine endoprotease [Azoarcus olearius]|uniref:Probable periplasmic serine endoprotease DegP-like n=1 Tax=Azoarcus sp. (strain BH72) TaxID=418699 RepID=A1KBT4_AZOSB|nr:DegQ family serine endoprotease [Azoarcus olearius]ANQ86836.1 serine protease MucD [Azoarcus olearius]CAL96290.1 probable serine protease MucD [Azoarcus olearius]
MQHPLRATTTASALILALAGAFGTDALAQAPAPRGLPAGSIVLPSFDTIIQRVGPAVVNISTEGPVRTGGPSGGLSPDDPFSEFFRRFGPPLGPQFGNPPGQGPVRGQGSGFIVSADGIVLTNAHVVDGASEVTVKLTDKREFKAKVLGVDKPTDVAVLRIDAKNLPTVPLGDPQKAHVGDWVLAIGAPFGFENSVTAGIISAKSRSLPNEGYVPFIQTDVAINPGNSGGPLLNLAGEVVGINSQIYSRSGGYQGLSFAIPIDVAAGVRDQIVAHGKVTRGRIGVAVQDVNQALAESFGLKSAGGALISSVEPGAPGDKAGLKVGDVIIELNGEKIVNSADLPPRVAAVRPGNTVRMKVWRKGESRDLEVKVGEFPDDSQVASSTGKADQGRLGLAVRALSGEERRQAGLPGGLVVTEVAGPAARAGIQRGDLILSINGQPVETVDQLRALVAKAGKHVALLVQRDEARIFVPVELG